MLESYQPNAEPSASCKNRHRSSWVWKRHSLNDPRLSEFIFYFSRFMTDHYSHALFNTSMWQNLIFHFVFSLEYFIQQNLVWCLESQLTYEDLNNLRNIKLLGDWRAKQKEENYLGRDEHRGKDIIHRAPHQMTLAHVCTFMLLPTENAIGLLHSSAKGR